MSILEALDDDECYLWAILSDESGLDLAEFSWKDENNDTGCWRAWPFQWMWFRNNDKFQIDQTARSLGKSVSIQLRGFIFAFVHPGQEMLITAPELIHLQPVTQAIESRIMSIRLSREMLDKKNRGTGFTHQPFGAQFSNGARISGRIPQRDGKGVKGCVVEGSLILTRSGLKPVEQLVKGDEVLTHRNRWRPVVAHYRHENADGFVIRGAGHRGLVVSDNHRMYGRRNVNPNKTRNLEEPTWVVADNEELSKRWYLGSPNTFPSLGVPEEFMDEKMMWVVGRYVADGHLTFENNTRGRVHIVACNAQLPEVEHGLRDAGKVPKSRVRSHNGTYDIEFCDTHLAREIELNFGRHADGKKLPVWLYGAPEGLRKCFLDGYLSGDGHWNEQKKRWQAGTASRELAVGLKMLGQSLGYSCSLSWVDVKPNKMCDNPLRSWRVAFAKSLRNVVREDGIDWRKITHVDPMVDIPAVYDITVDEDNSYVVDGLISHNQHPLWLELDEGQDYPEAGWVELFETLKFGTDTSSWRSHGVTRGVRDRFYELTQPESGWTVHRYCAMHRPDWTSYEREQKSLMYGGRNSSDYRRNILGEHGDQTNPLFVLARLMACVDSIEGSTYNQEEYVSTRITYEMLLQHALPIEEFIKVPASHRNYPVTWIGMDVGMTNHPTEILVFSEEPKNTSTARPGALPTNQIGATVMRLVSRWHLERISAPDQRRVLHELYSVYKPKGISLDKTGVGLPIFQDMLNEDPVVARVTKGYNFAAKIPVDFEDAKNIEDSLIMRNVLEYASDKLREFVDAGWIKMPWDLELIKEWQGQSYTVVKTTQNPYGKREYSKGTFHTLDAGRMAILGKVLDPIEKLLASPEEEYEGCIDIFYD